MTMMPLAHLTICFRPLPGSDVLKTTSTDEVSSIPDTGIATADSASNKEKTSLSLKDRLGMFPTCNAVFELIGL